MRTPCPRTSTGRHLHADESVPRRRILHRPSSPDAVTGCPFEAGASTVIPPAGAPSPECTTPPAPAAALGGQGRGRPPARSGRREGARAPRKGDRDTGDQGGRARVLRRSSHTSCPHPPAPSRQEGPREARVAPSLRMPDPRPRSPAQGSPADSTAGPQGGRGPRGKPDANEGRQRHPPTTGHHPAAHASSGPSLPHTVTQAHTPRGPWGSRDQNHRPHRPAAQVSDCTSSGPPGCELWSTGSHRA